MAERWESGSGSGSRSGSAGSGRLAGGIDCSIGDARTVRIDERGAAVGG
jgi:hypothetical protein